MKVVFAALALMLAAASPALSQQTKADPQNTVYLDTKDGRITIRLRPDLDDTDADADVHRAAMPRTGLDGQPLESRDNQMSAA